MAVGGYTILFETQQVQLFCRSQRTCHKLTVGGYSHPYLGIYCSASYILAPSQIGFWGDDEVPCRDVILDSCHNREFGRTSGQSELGLIGKNNTKKGGEGGGSSKIRCLGGELTAAATAAAAPLKHIYGAGKRSSVCTAVSTAVSTAAAAAVVSRRQEYRGVGTQLHVVTSIAIVRWHIPRYCISSNILTHWHTRYIPTRMLLFFIAK